MLREYSRLARPFFVMLAIVAVGRWLQGTAFGVPYEKGTHVFSIVTLTPVSYTHLTLPTILLV